MKSFKIDDEFYDGFSITQDFGHSPDQEFTDVKELLADMKLKNDDDFALSTMSIINDINIVISNKHQEELKLYKQIIKDNKIVSGTEPFQIMLAKELFIKLVTAVLGIFIVNALKPKSNEEEELVNKLLDELRDDPDNNEIEVKITKNIKVKKK